MNCGYAMVRSASAYIIPDGMPVDVAKTMLIQRLATDMEKQGLQFVGVDVGYTPTYNTEMMYGENPKERIVITAFVVDKRVPPHLARKIKPKNGLVITWEYEPPKNWIDISEFIKSKEDEFFTNWPVSAPMLDEIQTIVDKYEGMWITGYDLTFHKVEYEGTWITEGDKWGDSYYIDKSGNPVDLVGGKVMPSKVNPDGALVNSLPGLRTKVQCPDREECIGIDIALQGTILYNKRPPCCVRTLTVADMIIHLNDNRRWSRERIADWLDTLDVDLSFQPPETPDEPDNREE